MFLVSNQTFSLTEFFCCFAALVTLLVNDTATSEQRNTTVAVLGKGSSFGVCDNFFSSFVFISVIHEAHEGICYAHHSFFKLEGQGFLSDCSSTMSYHYCTLCDATMRRLVASNKEQRIVTIMSTIERRYCF